VSDEATAYHEAGHAVALFLLGRSPGATSIEPGVDKHGDPMLGFNKSPAPLRAGTLTDPREVTAGGVPELVPHQRKRVEEEIIVLFAGPAAEERFLGHANHEWAGGDHARVLALARLSEMHPDEEEAYLNWLAVRARLLLTGWAWSLVEGVAAELLTRRKLTAKETREAIVAAREAAIQRAVAAHPVFGQRAEETR
jgi:hypothetical protein